MNKPKVGDIVTLYKCSEWCMNKEFEVIHLLDGRFYFRITPEQATEANLHTDPIKWVVGSAGAHPGISSRYAGRWYCDSTYRLIKSIDKSLPPKQQAAWGKAEHKAPDGAAFEFL